MPWWKEEPWRMIQTNLREIDMQDLSAERFVADLKDFHATVVLLNAAGISAGYETKLPYHSRNPYLTGDSLERIVDLCLSLIHIFSEGDGFRIGRYLRGNRKKVL